MGKDEQLYEDLKDKLTGDVVLAVLFALLFLYALTMATTYLMDHNFDIQNPLDVITEPLLGLTAIGYPVLVIVLFIKQVKKCRKLHREARAVKARIKAQEPKLLPLEDK